MTEQDVTKLHLWLREAQTGHGERPVPFTPLCLVRARELFHAGTAPGEVVPMLRAEGLLA